MQQILTYIRKNPWKALRRTLFAVCLVAYLVYTGLQLFTVRQYYGVIRAVLEQVEYNSGYDVELDFSDTRIADNQQLQEQICEEMNPVSIRGGSHPYTLRLSGLNHVRIVLHYERIGKYDVSVHINYIEELDGKQVSHGAVGAYGYDVTYNPLLLSWRAKYTG